MVICDVYLLCMANCVLMCVRFCDMRVFEWLLCGRVVVRHAVLFGSVSLGVVLCVVLRCVCAWVVLVLCLFG